MKKAEIVKSMNGFLSKTSFQLKKHSPEILVVAGVILSLIHIYGLRMIYICILVLKNTLIHIPEWLRTGFIPL